MLRPDREPVLLFVALTLVGGLSASAAASGGWQVTRLRVNGVPLEVRTGEFDIARPRLTAALTTRWATAGTPILHNGGPSIGVGASRTVLGRQRGRLHETVTLSDAGVGRTRVLVAVSDLGVQPGASVRLPVGLPGGQRVLQVIEHGDARSAPRTFTLESTKEPQVAVSQWRRSLAAAGWSLRTVEPKAPGVQGWLLWADRGRERLDAVFSAGEDGTRIVVQVSGDAH